MKYFILIFILILFSCNQENYKKEFYSDKTLKFKVQVDDNDNFNGVYEEYYKSGELKMRTKYLNGIVIDTVFGFHKNGKLKEKGILKNNLKINWWNYYDSLGSLKIRNEYKIVNDSIYKNQTIHYDKDSNIIDSLSSFYNIKLRDTLVLGKNVGELYYSSNFNTNDRYLYIIVENHYSDLIKKRDTFIEEPDSTRFGVFAHKKGLKHIKATIIEQLIFEKEINEDSSELKIEEHKKYYEKDVYVIDSTGVNHSN